MSKGVPPRAHPRHHSAITPALHKPAGYGVHPAVVGKVKLSANSVKGMPMVKWPDHARVNEGDQHQPTDAKPIAKRQQFGGM
jgi:hypothetical protein